jgi:signal transduction histidine kinase
LAGEVAIDSGADLPADESMVDGQPIESPVAAADGKVNILVVDDRPEKLIALSAMLEGLHENVVLAGSGKEALRCLLQKEFAVILLDVHMPVMDGFETASLIRQRKSTASTPIIFITAYTDETHVARGYSLGAVDYILQPVEPEILRAKVSVFVELFRKTEEIKRQALLLQDINQELASANRAKDRFLTGISHELRTPLNAVIGFTGTLLMRLPGPLTADQERQLRVVQSSAKHLLSLINDLLDLARIEAGRTRVQIEPIACQPLIHQVVSSLRPMAESKGLRLDTILPPQDLLASADRRSMHQILLNLVNNAIKFTDKGGVTVELRRDGRDGIEVAVVDTGLGIRLEDQEKLFQAFTQIDPPPRRRFEGTGLGLHLSQKLAGLMGGWISFDSEYGKGSTFVLTVPEA